jgi:hypothetical protein
MLVGSRFPSIEISLRIAPNQISAERSSWDDMKAILDFLWFGCLLIAAAIGIFMAGAFFVQIFLSMK